MDNNPINNPFNERDMFGTSRDQNDREKVCPTCGTPLMGKENYCMGCGMNVEPIDKATYDHLKNEQNQNMGQGQNQGQNQYQGMSSNPYQNSYQGSYQSSGSSTPSRAVIKEESGLGKMLLIAIMAIAGVAAVFFLIMGIKDATKENIAIFTREISNGSQVVYETATIYAKGDKVNRMVDEARVDLSDMTQEQINFVINTMNMGYEEYLKYSFINTEVVQVDKTVIAKLEYNYLNVEDNLSKLLEMNLLDIGRRSEVTYKDYISLKKTTESMKKEGWIQKQ